MRQELDECQIKAKLMEIHDWAHHCFEALEPGQLGEVDRIANQLLAVLNELAETPNCMKFLATFAVLSLGADLLDAHLKPKKSEETVTIQ